ncbi:hypothetical protein MOC16_gp104 [Klebsiella phage vB_KpM_FBKp24]|uniref:Tail fibers protein n=1 Tax=Klebsiella phage vB_KpM_FBKp24 TaxID=2801834 RepID=A0A7U0J654_9CAUD|nr:hypothetical protein MOC16_gp104 [Klebsiella phage vB_KpM_FBKp24]QQV92005.1 hypothetical protein vBKpMFBKp24_309 [Klebsiella phage vB_KpM_FBKp24]
MSDIFSQKISELQSSTGPSENAYFPLSEANNDFSEKVSITTLRETIGFENAFPTVAIALLATKESDVFFVYEDDKKENVLGYVNQGNGSYSALMTDSNTQLRYATSSFVVNSLFFLRGAESFEELRTIKPWYEGQRIKLKSYYVNGLTGGGEFVARLTGGVDDGGFIAAGEGYYWERAGDEISLNNYGVYYQDINANGKINFSNAVQSAINRAKNKKLPLITNFPSENHYVKGGIYLESGIDITGIKSIEGALPIIIDSSIFTGLNAIGYPGITWVLLNINGSLGTDGMIFGTSVGNQTLDTIAIRDLNPRSKPLGGQLHTFSGTTINGALCATGFDGPGVYLSNCYDSNIQDIRAIESGNISWWSISIDSYPKDSTSSLDTSNHLVIGSIEPHDCHERILNVNASASSVDHIHEEASYVTDTTTWGSATVSSNGFGWTNTLLAGWCSRFGVVRVLPKSTNTGKHVTTVVSDQISIDTFQTEGNLGLHFTYTNPVKGSSYGTIEVGTDLYITTNVPGSIGHCLVKGANSVVTQLSKKLNVRSMMITGSSSSLVDSGGVYGNLEAIVATIDSGVVSKGSITTLTSTGSTSLSNIGIVTLTLNGTRTTVKDCYISGVSSFSGDGVVSGTTLVGASSFSGSFTCFGIKTNANLSISNTSAQTYNFSLRDSFINGQLSITNYVKVNIDFVRVINLYISITSGFLLLSNIQMTGSLTGNVISSTNVPALGSSTTDPTNGNSYIFQSGGWKMINITA